MGFDSSWPQPGLGLPHSPRTRIGKDDGERSPVNRQNDQPRGRYLIPLSLARTSLPRTLLRGRALPSSEITALQTACSTDPGAAGIRDAGIIGVLYGTGLRRSEVVNLDCSHYKQDVNEVTVFGGKGRKDRLVYVPDGTKEAIRDWLGLRGSDAGPLFCHVNKAGRISLRRLSGQGIWHILRKRGEQAGVESFTPHDLRRSCITDLLAGGADIFVVQQLAGHSDPKTTMRYDRRGEEAKRTASAKLRVPYFGKKLDFGKRLAA
jgi:site-specific recombinase XerD